MAKTTGVWGIDIGQSALKALRCKIEDGQVVADAFDYIEHPKILTQPEADPEQLIREALETFLSRNEVKGDMIAISVPGQSGLAKFFKPPPVDAKKIPDIVKYEARQQIPFALEDVIWDYQQMGGGAEVEGFALETEVGLFAMKREQVYRALRPFDNVDLEVDIIQLAPLAIYNFVTFEQLDQHKPEDFDPDNPPASLVVLSIGTDTTDLVITNGFRVWQRSIPLGGNHFTKQLTKELKLTFAKAEHLKRNARQAEDPKAVFQAMRPVFNDMVTEVQRSIGYFQSIDRKATIGGVVLLGNAMKLPGLKQYLAKHLGYETVDLESFSKLEGSSVVGSPAFKDNAMAFAVTYGLCLQGLKKGRLQTNLVPRELLVERMVRAKKPWTVAAVAFLLLACALSFYFYHSRWSYVQPETQVNNVTWKDAESAATAVATTSANFVKDDTDREAKMLHLLAIGEEVVGDADRRILWLELLKAINQALPKTPGVSPRDIPDPKVLPFGQRQELFIQSVESEYFVDLSLWFSEEIKKRYNEHTILSGIAEKAGVIVPGIEGYVAPEGAAAAPATDFAMAPDPYAAAADPYATTDPTAAAASDINIPPPTGPGWVIELKGYHYFNDNFAKGGPTHVRNTLLTNLLAGKVTLPVPGVGPVEFTMQELGINYPTLAVDGGKPVPVKLPNPNFVPTPGMMGPGGTMPGMPVTGATSTRTQTRAGQPGASGEAAANVEKPFFEPKKYSFVVQFAWQPKLLSERLTARQEQAEQAQQTEGEESQPQQPDQADVAATLSGAE